MYHGGNYMDSSSHTSSSSGGGGLDTEAKRQWKTIIELLESMPDEESEWAFATMKEALQYKFIDDEEIYRQAVKPYEYINIKKIKNKLNMSYKTNTDVYLDFKHMFTNGLRYYSDPSLDSVVHEYRRFTWAMLQKFDQALESNPVLKTRLLQEGLRFRVFYNAFPGALPVVKMLEAFHESNWDDTYHLYYRDGYYHPDDNYEEPEDYLQYVKEPIFLADVFANLALGAYTNYDKVKEDVEKVFNNNIVYFGENTEQGERSIKLRQFFQTAWNNALPAIQSSAQRAIQQQQLGSTFGAMSGSGSSLAVRTPTSTGMFTISSQSTTASKIQRGARKSTKQQGSNEDYDDDVHGTRTLSSSLPSHTPSSSTGLKMKLSLKRTTTSTDTSSATPNTNTLSSSTPSFSTLSSPPVIPPVTPLVPNAPTLTVHNPPFIGMSIDTPPLTTPMVMVPPASSSTSFFPPVPPTVPSTVVPLEATHLSSLTSSTSAYGLNSSLALPTASLIPIHQSSAVPVFPTNSLGGVNGPTQSFSFASANTGLGSSMTGLSSMNTGLGSGMTGLNGMNTGLGSSMTGLSGMNTGLGSGMTGLSGMNTGLGSGMTGLNSMGTGLGGSLTGLNTMSTGLGSSTTGFGGSTTGLNSMSTGLSSSSTGLNSMSTGLGGGLTGLNANTTGLGSFSTGLGSSSTGLPGIPVFSSVGTTSSSTLPASTFLSGPVTAASIAAASSTTTLPPPLSLNTTIPTTTVTTSTTSTTATSRLPPPVVPPQYMKKTGTTTTTLASSSSSVPSSSHRSAPTERSLQPKPTSVNQLLTGKVPTTPEEIQEHMQQFLKHIYSPGIRVNKKVHIKGSKKRIDSINLTPFFESNPVTQGASDYNDRIEKPIWMAKIVEQYQNGYYTTAEALRDDLLLIGTNCKKYNAGVTEWEWRATHWMEAITRLYDKLFRGVVPRRGRPPAGWKGDAEAARLAGYSLDGDVGSVSSNGRDFSRSDSPTRDDDFAGDTSMMDTSTHHYDGDTTMNGGKDTHDDYNAALLGVEEAMPGTEFTVPETITTDHLMSIENETLPSRTEGLPSTNTTNVPATTLAATETGRTDTVMTTTDTSTDTIGKSNRLLRFSLKSNTVASSSSSTASTTAAPSFSDDAVLSHDQLYIIKTIFDPYPFFNEPLSKELRSLCDGLLRRLSKHELCRGSNSIPSLVTSAMKDPRFFAILWRLGLLAKPAVTFSDITNKLHNTLETAFLAEEMNRLSNYEYTRKYRDRIQAMRQAIKYETLGEFVKDLLDLFSTAITLYAKDTWTAAGLPYEVGWLETRYLRAQAMRDYVRSLLREYFAATVAEEAKEIAGERQSLRQLVENTHVTPSTRPVLLSAVQTMLGVNDLGRKSGFAKLSKEFSAPVGILHPDIPGHYWTIITQPMDFGTVSEQLQMDTNAQSEKNGSRTSVYYATHGQFATDMVLTLQNAMKYNSFTAYGDAKIYENARTLLSNWTNVVWPETCLDVSLILKLEGYEQGATERIRKAEEERQEATRRSLQAAAYVQGTSEVVRDADIWITRTTEALRTGDLEALPGIFLPTDGALGRAAEKLNYQPTNALTAITAALEREQRKTLSISGSSTVSNGPVITPVKGSSKLLQHLQSFAETNGKTKASNTDSWVDMDTETDSTVQPLGSLVSALASKKSKGNGKEDGSTNSSSSSSSTIITIPPIIQPGKQTSVLLAKLGIPANLSTTVKSSTKL